MILIVNFTVFPQVWPNRCSEPVTTVGGETDKSKMLGVEVSHPTLLCISIRKLFGWELRPGQ
jgi:hypothetical protein